MQTTNITYDLSWPHLQHTVSTNGLNANFTYDSSGKMLTRHANRHHQHHVPYSTNGQTRTWTYTYNGTGEVLTAQLPRTDLTAKTTYGYAGGKKGGNLIRHGRAFARPQRRRPRRRRTTPENQGAGQRLTTRPCPPPPLAVIERHARIAGNLTTAHHDSAGNLPKSAARQLVSRPTATTTRTASPRSANDLSRRESHTRQHGDSPQTLRKTPAAVDQAPAHGDL